MVAAHALRLCPARRSGSALAQPARTVRSPPASHSVVSAAEGTLPVRLPVAVVSPWRSRPWPRGRLAQPPESSPFGPRHAAASRSLSSAILLFPRGSFRETHFHGLKCSFFPTAPDGEGLVILRCAVADGNSTRSPENDGLLCGNAREDCAATTTQSEWNDYFSPCPKKYEHYCINGKCRFVGALQTPSCLCDDGYTGARCERVDFFYLRGDTGQILVISLTAVLVTLIILVVGVCTCCHPLRRKRKEDTANVGKDITPVNEDIQETSIV
ncbi:PREDICTED: probetacellulin [Miniopterus natalensis]|uniref:probetacellulin n=1 Tax=Miniopterus natalensis TaxID=291302 RepID=UPI0007A6D9A2|nr:PREDICTED: probetacellulin [Miniopterus natalensis]